MPSHRHAVAAPMRTVAVLAFATAFALATGCRGDAHRPAADIDAARVGAPTDAAAPPLLRLAPGALPGGLARQQRLTFAHDGRRDVVDALVEADADAVRVVLHVGGQPALRLLWDGRTLDEQRAGWLPAGLQGERVLSDLQLVHWPADAIRAALPAGWTLVADASRRELRDAGRSSAAIAVEYRADGVVVVRHAAPPLELRIESRAVTP